MRNDTQRTDLFIEKRLPVQTLNEQVYYEHGGNPFKGLHRWYSRKPLSFSRASVLASLLPGDVSMEEFEDLLGLQPGKEVKLYKTPPTPELIKKVQGYCLEVWGNPTPRILDAFAGGGSIPFEAVRYGLNVLASDLNPVAVVTMKAAIEYPLKFGPDLQDDIDKWVKWVGDETEKRLTEFFPSLPGETVQNYLWAHTIVCPHCESIIPLSPNWWLYKRPEKQNLHKWCAIKPIPNPENKRIDFELIKGTKGKGTTIQTDDGQYDPDTITTIARGVGKCLNCGNIIEDNVIKSQAQTQGLGYQLYAIAYKKGQNSLEFRTPQDIDLDGIEKSGNNLNVVSERYHSNTYPQEQVVFGDKTKELIRYGIDNWSKLFNPRQLLTLATYVEIINEAKNLIYQEYQKQKQEKITKLQTEGQTELQPNLTAELELFYQTKYEAISTYLTLVLDRCVDKNSRLSHWDSSRISSKRASTQHSLNLMWNYPETNGLKELWFSCAEACASDYQTLCTYLGTTLGTNQNYGIEIHDSKSIQIELASADNLTYIPDNSIHAIITDPPYYSTIQYAELSDFFYVWQKRILGDIFPELFYLELTDKEQEAVANPSRFRNMGISPEELANQDYEAKMSMAFAEYHRVLHKDGVMTVQFNHKDSGAWDVLAKSLIEAGFEITASWSVSTENPQNLHQAQKNAVSSTVLLVCRKRPPHAEQGWWDDVRLELRNTILTKAPEIERSLVADSRPAPDRVQDPRVRIKPPGIDLCLTAYGSALSVFTRYTSILDSSGVRVEPKAAFEEVRQAIVSYRLERLLAGKDFYGVDSLTQWYILAWDTFEAREFPFDEARQLALAVGGFDVSDLVKKYKLLDSTSGFCKLLTPEQRLKKRAFSVVETEFSGLNLVDGIHAIICIYQTEQKIEFVRKFLKNTELVSKDAFMKTFELVLKVIPQIKDESKRIIEEKVLLDLWLAMDEIKAKVSYQQMELLSNPSATDDHPNQMSLF
jgi:adenine-specific DNA methylase